MSISLQFVLFCCLIVNLYILTIILNIPKVNNRIIGLESYLKLINSYAGCTEHFKAISNGNVVYDVVDSYQSLLEIVTK